MGDGVSRGRLGVAGVAVVLALIVGVAPAARGQSGFLGLEIQGTEDARAIAALGPDRVKGVLVKDVAVGEAAAVAGFRRGDVIVGFDGAEIDTFDDLMKAVAKTKVGQKITITVMRADKPVELTLRTTARPPAWNVTTSLFNNYPELGFTVAAINEPVRKQFSLPWGTLGLVVTIVDANGRVASAAGLRVGEVIVQANLRDIWEPRQLTRAIEDARKAGRSHVLLLVFGSGGYRYSALPVK